MILTILILLGIGLALYSCVTHGLCFLVGVLLAVGYTLALILVFLLLVALLSVFIRIDRPADRRTRFYHWLMTNIVEVGMFLLRVRMNVTGREKIPRDTRFLLVCNHRTIFDPVLTMAELSEFTLAFISKKENFKIPIVNKLMHMCFCLPLDRNDNRAAVRTINEAVELAKKYNVELEVLSSLNPIPGTVVKEVTKDMEGMLIKGVAKDTDVAVITILNVPDEPGMSFKIFGLLAQKNINVDIILQSTGRDGKKDISFTCSEGEADLAMRVLKESAHFKDVSVDTTCAKVSIVGAGMQSHSGVASKMFEALSNNNINIKMISTSEIKISCIINREDADKAVSSIHDMLFD